MLTSILAKTNTQSTNQSICRLTFGQVLANMSAKMSANTSADISTDSQPIWQLRVSWYGSWRVDQVVANRVDQYSTMGCSNYTRPEIFYCSLQLRMHQKALKGFSLMICYDGIPIPHSFKPMADCCLIHGYKIFHFIKSIKTYSQISTNRHLP